MRALKVTWKIVYTIGVILYFLLMYLLLVRGLPNRFGGFEYLIERGNFIPFSTVSYYINAISDGTIQLNIALNNLIGNSVILMPLGIILPGYFKTLSRPLKFIAVVTLSITLVEMYQGYFGYGSFDIDDILLNVIGATVVLIIRNLVVYLWFNKSNTL